MGKKKIEVVEKADKSLTDAWRIEISKLSAEELFNHATVEMYHGGVFPNRETFCGACWVYLRETDEPGKRIIDWDYFAKEIPDILNALDHFGADKKHTDYVFLQTKYSLVKAKGLIDLKPEATYSDTELLCLAFTVIGNRLEIPKDIFIPNYNEVKQIMKNFDGVYKNNGFDFKYPASQVLERIRNKETTNLKKKFQYYGTPKELCALLCEKAFDPYENKKIQVLEPSAGQGAIMDSVLEWFENEAVNLELKKLTAIEFMDENHLILKEKFAGNPLVRLHKGDFLAYDRFINYFDVVIANPPFSGNQDIKHFYKMYEVCKPNGIVCSIMSTGFIYNSGKVHKEFREFIGMGNTAQDRADAKTGTVFTCTSKEGYDQTVYVQVFNDGEFKESGTGVSTALIVMRKQTVTL